MYTAREGWYPAALRSGLEATVGDQPHHVGFQNGGNPAAE